MPKDGKRERLCATVHIEEALRETELCFVAVATPSRPNGQIDPAHLFRACSSDRSALAKFGRKQIVVIRSSVLPSIFDECRTIFDDESPWTGRNCAPIRSSSGKARRSVISRSPRSRFSGRTPRDAEDALRSLYSDQSAPMFVLEPREALMVKYASNAFHALKVAFANEIAAVCQQAEVDAEAVMNVFCSDTKLNISRPISHARLRLRRILPAERCARHSACRQIAST